MAYIKVANTVITRYVTAQEQQERTLVVNTAIDGTKYMTRFGSPVKTFLLSVMVDRAGRDALFSAADALDLLEVSVKAGVIHGRIEKLENFSQPYDDKRWFTASITLAVDSEVSAV